MNGSTAVHRSDATLFGVGIFLTSAAAHVSGMGSDAVEEWSRIRGCRVGEGCDVGLTANAGQELEGGQIGGAQEKVSSVGNALPTERDVRCAAGRSKHAKDGGAVGGVGAGEPF